MTPRTANILGLLALVFWSMNVAVIRRVGEANPLGLPGLSLVLAGAAMIAVGSVTGSKPPWRSNADRRYWIFGGIAFVLNSLFLISALSYSSTRTLVLPLGLVNYFWPSIILVLLPFFFRRRVNRALLAAGILLCVAGVASAMFWGADIAAIAADCVRNWPALAMMAVVPFAWAFYSNASRKWGGNANGVGWFQLIAGICFLLLWTGTGEPMGFTRDMLLPFLVHSLLVNAAAYAFWDAAMRHGDIALMGSMANALPITSILFSVWYLGEALTPGLAIGAALVAAGAILCRRGAPAETE